MSKSFCGVIGLAVMGSNLARNIESRGYMVSVYNRTTSVTDEFMSNFGEQSFISSKTLEEFVESIEKPRKIISMVKAGNATDAVVDALIPLLDKGDILIDGGNAWFEDTIRRENKCTEAGINFVGAGISGGEEGALKGPSIMPGGPKEAWDKIAELFDKIAAKVDGSCTTYMGPDGAGHFVKMVHNGIEYGDMQLIAEAYHLLVDLCGADPKKLNEVFTKWNDGVLSSFLIEITSKIFTQKDDKSDDFLVNKILDKAGQKGTGKWTAQVALDLGVAIPTISAAVDARILSSIKAERQNAESTLKGPKAIDSVKGEEFVQQIHDALYCSKIVAYAQGMAMLSSASKEYNWNLQLDEIARIWKGGCIIRARFLGEIQRAYKENPEMKNLLLDSFMQQEVERCLPSLRKVCQTAIEVGVPIPAFSSALAYYDSYRLGRLPQNLTQAQRDFFGAHTYERVDTEGSFHTEWVS